MGLFQRQQPVMHGDAGKAVPHACQRQCAIAGLAQPAAGDDIVAPDIALRVAGTVEMVDRVAKQLFRPLQGSGHVQPAPALGLADPLCALGRCRTEHDAAYLGHGHVREAFPDQPGCTADQRRRDRGTLDAHQVVGRAGPGRGMAGAGRIDVARRTQAPGLADAALVRVCRQPAFRIQRNHGQEMGFEFRQVARQGRHQARLGTVLIAGREYQQDILPGGGTQAVDQRRVSRVELPCASIGGIDIRRAITGRFVIPAVVDHAQRGHIPVQGAQAMAEQLLVERLEQGVVIAGLRAFAPVCRGENHVGGGHR